MSVTKEDEKAFAQFIKELKVPEKKKSGIKKPKRKRGLKKGTWKNG